MKHERCTWYDEPHTQQVNEGDLVQLTKGERIIRDRVIAGHFGELRLLLTGDNVSDLVASNWSLTVIERAKPKPGVYLDKDGDVWAFPPAEGSPRLLATGDGTIQRFFGPHEEDWADWAPFTPITVKEARA